jgi:hypothetical protein
MWNMNNTLAAVDEQVVALGTNPWERLANGIILQAVEDYRMLENAEDLEEIEEFFRSEWFEVLTTLDPHYLIAQLKSEKTPTKWVFSEEDEQRNERAFGTPAGSETI